VTGPNGAGKSTLLRTVCSHFSSDAYKGRVVWGGKLSHSGALDDPACIMFLPQKPLLAPGPTLSEQVTYPGIEPTMDIDAHGVLRPVLVAVGLGHLVDRHHHHHPMRVGRRLSDNVLGDEGDGSSGAPPEKNSKNPNNPWEHVSVGEMQRLCLARVLFRKPLLALLDEPTSAMSDAAAGQLLGLLRDAGVTYVTVGQDTPELRAAHAQHLKLGLNGSGDWSLESL